LYIFFKVSDNIFLVPLLSSHEKLVCICLLAEKLTHCRELFEFLSVGESSANRDSQIDGKIYRSQATAKHLRLFSQDPRN
jgi:hypothetical protein